MILLGRVHHAFQRIDTAEPHHLDLVAISELLEAFRYLIADHEVMRRFLLLKKLRLGRLLLL
jgi:hypothetical protein